MSSSRTAARTFGWLLAYGGLTVWLTWPLLTTLTTKLPCTDFVCTFDTLYSAWVLSWLSHAAVTAPWQYADANIYHPTPLALYYGPAGLGAAPYALPAYLATGNPAAALNTALIACATLSAFTTHWVARRWTGSDAAGFVAGFTVLMSRWFLWGFVASTTHLAALQYVPLVAYLAAEPLRSRRQALLLLLVITLQCLTDIAYVAPAVLAPLGLLALARLGRRAWRPSGWRLLGVLVAVPLCLAPFAMGYLRVRQANPSLQQQTTWPSMPEYTIAGVIPTDLAAAIRSGFAPWTPSPPLIGFILAGLLVAMLRRRPGSGLGRAWSHAALWTLAGIWISLTPVVSWGEAWKNDWAAPQIYLPQYLLYLATPFYSIARVPGRLGVAAMFGSALMVGVAFAELTRLLPALRLRGPSAAVFRVALALCLAVLAYRVPPIGAKPLRPAYPRQDAPPTDPAMLRALRATGGPLLELPALDPVLKTFSPRLNVVAMYRSALHWRPLVNGYSSYWPAGFMERLALTEQLPATSALHQLVCETGVRSIMVNLMRLPRERRVFWRRANAVLTPGLRFRFASGPHLLFDVTVPLPGQPGAPACAPSAPPVLGAGEHSGDER